MKAKMESRTATADTAELESLMREFPDWKQEFPELNKSVYPARYYKARKSQNVGNERVIQKRTKTVPISDYQDEYRSKARVGRPRPRSTKRPPPTPMDPRPPPMAFTTNQRDHYTPKDLDVRPRLILQVGQYEVPEGKVESFSRYRQDYPAHPVALPGIRATAPQGTVVPGKFDGLTVTRQDYKKWAANPSLTFSELPCFAGSLLYPDDKKVPETTTGGTYKGKFAQRPDLMPRAEATIKVEGDMDLNTTHRVTYQDTEGARPAERMQRKTTVNVTKRGKVSDSTQNRRDFPGYEVSGQPAPPNTVTPHPTTIDLKFDNRTDFQTEQRSSYPGVDASLHPPPAPCIKENKEYIPPTVKFDAISHVKQDFPPIDLKSVYQPAKRPTTQTPASVVPKFQSTTTNSHFYRKYDVQPRVKQGDFHENHSYVPPMDRFEHKSTTHDTFLGKMAPIRPPFLPDDKPVEKIGDLDFNTVHRTTYSQPSPMKQLTKEQKKVLIKQLRRRKELEMGAPTPLPATSGGLAIATN